MPKASFLQTDRTRLNLSGQSGADRINLRSEHCGPYKSVLRTLRNSVASATSLRTPEKPRSEALAKIERYRARHGQRRAIKRGAAPPRLSCECALKVRTVRPQTFP